MTIPAPVSMASVSGDRSHHHRFQSAARRSGGQVMDNPVFKNSDVCFDDRLELSLFAPADQVDHLSVLLYNGRVVLSQRALQIDFVAV